MKATTKPLSFFFHFFIINKIDAVLQSIDAYIIEYEKGLTLAKDLKIIEPKNILINGVWSVEVIEKIILRLEETMQEIEKEFRALYEAK